MSLPPHYLMSFKLVECQVLAYHIPASIPLLSILFQNIPTNNGLVLMIKLLQRERVIVITDEIQVTIMRHKVDKEDIAIALI